MKLIFGIALVLGLMMLGEGIALGVMIALAIAFAVRVALPFGRRTFQSGARHHSAILFARAKCCLRAQPIKLSTASP